MCQVIKWTCPLEEEEEKESIKPANQNKKKKTIEPVFGWEIGLVIRPPEVLIGLTSGKKKKEKEKKEEKEFH